MITLDALAGTAHGFFTRQGGVSGGVYASLNCGFGSDDEADAVAENRTRVMGMIGLPPERLATVHQIHSAEVVRVTAPWPRVRSPQADALVTDRPGIALGILTADCLPVLFVDAETGIIGAAHAGWKGALGGVLEATVAAMVELGARTAWIRAGLGPAIRQASYEVGPEFRARFIAADPAYACYFAPAERAGHFMADLPGFAAGALARLGLAEIADCGLDTAADPARFFSYRRATIGGEPDYGRQISVIALPGEFS